MRIRIVLVEPEYEINVGAIARLLANFNQKRLYIVNPKCELGFTARMHAKHAGKILLGAKICKSVGEATKGCRMVVGTTGVLRRHKKLLRNPISPSELSLRLKKNNAEVAVLFGREGIGLNAQELQQCDILCIIPTSLHYPVMNLSHAVAVMLYALCLDGKEAPHTRKNSSAGEMRALGETMQRLVERRGPQIRNIEKTKLAFKTVIGRAVPSDIEVKCMLGVLRGTLRELEKEGGN